MNNSVRKLITVINEFALTPIINFLPAWVTPNILTSFRLFLIIPIVVCIITHLWGLFIVIYLISLLSDGLDGALSRKRNMKTDFGAKFDPVVDKIIHVTLLIFLIPFAPIYIFSIIILDIVILLGGWIIVRNFRKNKHDLPIKGANYFGKLKVFSQGLIIILLYSYQIFPQTISTWPLAIILIIITLIFSTLSIINYALTLIRIKFN